MPRPLRILYPNAWYHVMNRGRRGENVFPDDLSRHSFIKLLQESTEMWQLRISAFCLMGNHYHLLVQTPLGNLPRCMRHVDGVYTQRTNKRLGWEGQIFKGRYKAILVDRDSYLLQVMRYIHRNPVRDGLASGVDAYEWSSHKAYISTTARWNWLHVDFVLGMLDRDPRRQKSAYLRFVRAPDSKDLVSFYSSSRPGPVLGISSFVKGIRDTFRDVIDREDVSGTIREWVSLEAIKKGIAAYYKLSPEALTESRRRLSNEPRDLAVSVAKSITGQDLRAISAEFGFSGPNSVSAAIFRHRKRAAADPNLRRQEATIMKTLTNK